LDDEVFFLCFSQSIDEGIRPHLRKINGMGFTTFTSCSGLWRDHQKNFLKEFRGVGGYVSFLNSEKLTKELLFMLGKTMWMVEIGYSDVVGECITFRLPLSLDGKYIEDCATSHAWDILVEILERGDYRCG